MTDLEDIQLCAVVWPGRGHPHHCDDLAGHGGSHWCAEEHCTARRPRSEDDPTHRPITRERYQTEDGWWWHR
jgi:hypothetical protein